MIWVLRILILPIWCICVFWASSKFYLLGNWLLWLVFFG